MKSEEVRRKSEYMEKLALEVMAENPDFDFIADNGIRICYLSSSKEKKAAGGIVHGECEKIADKYKWAIPYDFSITFYEPNNISLDEEQMKILMRHELMHVGQDDKGNLRIVPHDVEDFAEILSEHGIFWSCPKTVQNCPETVRTVHKEKK